MLAAEWRGNTNWGLKIKNHSFQWCKQRKKLCTDANCSSNSLSVHFSLCLWPEFISRLCRATWKDAEHMQRKQTSWYSQAEGLSTAGVNHMIPTASTQESACPQDLRDWEIFSFLSETQTDLFWRLLIYAFLMIYFDYEFWWLIPGFCVLCSRHFWENTLKIHLLILQKNQWKLFSMLTIINSYLTGPQNMKKTGNKGFFSLLHTGYLCRHSHCKLCLMHMQ